MNILVIRFSSFGDIVMTTAVVEALHRFRPDANLYFLTKREFSGLFPADNRLRQVIAIDGNESPSRIAASIPDTMDTVIDLHASLRSRAVTALLRAPRKMRLKKHALGRRIMVRSRGLLRRRYDVLGSYLDTLRPLGVSERVFPRLIVDDATRNAMRAQFDGDARLIGIAPGARHETKRWDEASYARLADSCVADGYVPLFLGSRNDVPVIERIMGSMHHAHRAISTAGSTDIQGTVATISLLDGLVTNDSGPMHVAGALRIPFVAVFGPTHPNLGFVPGYPCGRVIHSGVPCSPCSIHGECPCRMQRRMCMEQVTWEMVHAALTESMEHCDTSRTEYK